MKRKETFKYKFEVLWNCSSINTLTGWDLNKQQKIHIRRVKMRSQPAVNGVDAQADRDVLILEYFLHAWRNKEI